MKAFLILLLALATLSVPVTFSAMAGPSHLEPVNECGTCGGAGSGANCFDNKDVERTRCQSPYNTRFQYACRGGGRDGCCVQNCP